MPEYVSYRVDNEHPASLTVLSACALQGVPSTNKSSAWEEMCVRVQTLCAGPGVFADSRLTALRSIEELVQNHQLLLAAVSADRDLPHSVSNQWMASTRKHPFWLFTIVQMLEAGGALAARCVRAIWASCGHDTRTEPHAGA